MTIETRTKTFYYCTECDFEYDEEDKEVGNVCLSCTNHPDIEGCTDCMYQCDEEADRNLAGIAGCNRWYCQDCMVGTYSDGWYPSLLCNNCLKKYKGIERFYDDHGEKINNEIKEWMVEEFGENYDRNNKEVIDKTCDKWFVKPVIE